MRNTIYLLLVFLAFSCSSGDDEKESYTFRNSTEFEVIVSANDQFLDGSQDFDFVIGACRS